MDGRVSSHSDALHRAQQSAYHHEYMYLQAMAARHGRGIT
jgi:hypothetical protein